MHERNLDENGNVVALDHRRELAVVRVQPHRVQRLEDHVRRRHDAAEARGAEVVSGSRDAAVRMGVGPAPRDWGAAGSAVDVSCVVAVALSIGRHSRPS